MNMHPWLWCVFRSRPLFEAFTLGGAAKSAKAASTVAKVSKNAASAVKTSTKAAKVAATAGGAAAGAAKLSKNAGAAVKTTTKGAKAAAKAAEAAAEAAKVADKAAKVAKLKKVVVAGLAVGAVAAAIGVGVSSNAKADKINNTPYGITSISNGSSNKEFIVSYTGDDTFNQRDTFRIENTNCKQPLPPSFSGVKAELGKVTLSGTEVKLDPPCTSGTLRVQTSVGNVIGGAVQGTVNTVVGTVVNTAGDVATTTSSGVFNSLSKMLGFDFQYIIYVVVAIAIAFVCYKLYLMSKAKG